MAGRLDGKAALITGGSRGIGAAIARRFAREGAGIAITYVGKRTEAEALVAELSTTGVRGTAHQADAVDPEAVRAAVDHASAQLGGLDIVVHSAGVSTFQLIEGSDERAYDAAARRHLAVNVEGVVTATRAALPCLRDGGRIIVIGSVNAHQMPLPGTALYGASKAAVAALARGWARELGGRGILVNVIQPGPIETGMNPNDGREEVRVMTAMTALRRYGQPHEIASLATFLASDESSYITGATIDIDGGFSI